MKQSRKPKSADDLVGEAFALQQQGEAIAAARMYREALKLAPAHHAAMSLLAMILIERDVRAAIGLLEQAIALAPRVAWYHLTLGHAYAAAGDDERAVAAMQASARLDRSSAIPRYDLARHHLQHRRSEPALAALRDVLAVDPAHARARFLVASLTGGQVETAPADYVTELFDSYAPAFEAHLVEGLQYRAPSELAELVASDGTDGARAWQVVDLGCGSGLAGVAFRALARHLIGSDLSPKMIEVARARGVYDELHVEDLLATLARARDVDLVIAADVFIYVGALEAAFAAVATSLRPGGRFALSTEAHDGDGVVLRPSSRYAHADGYIRGLAAQHGFEVRLANATTVRVEHGAPIAGMLYLLIRGAGSQP